MNHSGSGHSRPGGVSVHTRGGYCYVERDVNGEPCNARFSIRNLFNELEAEERAAPKQLALL